MGAEPVVKVIGKEVILIWATPGRTWTHESGGMRFRLLCPHAPVPLLQGARIEHRGEDDMLLPHLRQLALRDGGFHLLALARLGRHGGYGGGGRGR